MGESEDSEIAVLKVGKTILGVKEELDEHRTSINDNTNEISSNYEFLCELDRKLEFLAKKVEEISRKIDNKEPLEHEFVVEPLTRKEKEVFAALYCLGEEKGGSVSYSELSLKLGMSEQLVSSYIANFIAKGIPVRKRYFKGSVRVSLEQRFKEAQAKKNIVGINTLLTYWLGRTQNN